MDRHVWYTRLDGAFDNKRKAEPSHDCFDYRYNLGRLKLKTVTMISNLKGGIQFEVVWFDQDVLECQLRCSNGYFSGVAEVYLRHDDLPNMAAALKGFPTHATDYRNIELGTFDPKCAGGGVRMYFYCTDSVGHAAVDVKLRGDACIALGEIESVALRIPIEAASVDYFIAQVKSMDASQIGAMVGLDMAG